MSILKIPVTPEDHIQGKANAPITLVEYGDYECPFCGNAYPVVKQLQQHFGEDLRFVFRNFPLTEVHLFAEPASEAAELAADYDHFWEMHDLLYENQSQLSLPFLLELGANLNLPVEDLEFAIKHKVYGEKIQHDFMGGIRSGVNGTPTFFINSHRYNGPFEFEDLAAAIQSVSVS